MHIKILFFINNILRIMFMECFVLFPLINKVLKTKIIAPIRNLNSGPGIFSGSFISGSGLW